MKKIVMGIAAVAMAASMFAADVSAKLKLGTSLWESNKVLTTPTSTGWDVNNTFFKLAASGDNSGVEFCLFDEDAKFHGLSMWFKPTDSLKITVGNMTVGTITKGTFAYWAQSVKQENEMGVKLDASFGDFSLEVASLHKGLLDTKAKGLDMIGNFWIGGTYAMGNAGTIQGFITKGALLNAYGVGGWKNDSTNTEDYYTMGLAYDHQPWEQTGFFADAYVNFTGSKFEFDQFGTQIGGQFVNDGLALRMVNIVTYGNRYGTPKTLDYGCAAQASYAIDAWTPYVKVIYSGIKAKKVEIETGVDTTVGGVAINANVDVVAENGKDVAVKVPVSFTYAF